MAAKMITPAITRINLDYNRKMAELNRQRELEEINEYARMAKQQDEMKIAVTSIERQNSLFVNTDASDSEHDEVVQNNQPTSTSTSPNSSTEQKREMKITLKRPINESHTDSTKAKKRYQKHLKPNIQPFIQDSEMLNILNTLKADMCKLKDDNITIMDRIAVLESPNQNVPTKGTPAATPHKGAYLSLKMIWIPEILRLLNLIYSEMQISEDEKND